jgi:hypothetical protein
VAYAVAYASKPLDASRFQNSTTTHGFTVRAARECSFRKVVPRFPSLTPRKNTLAQWCEGKRS